MGNVSLIVIPGISAVAQSAIQEISGDLEKIKRRIIYVMFTLTMNNATAHVLNLVEIISHFALLKK